MHAWVLFVIARGTEILMLLPGAEITAAALLGAAEALVVRGTLLRPYPIGLKMHIRRPSCGEGPPARRKAAPTASNHTKAYKGVGPQCCLRALCTSCWRGPAGRLLCARQPAPQGTNPTLLSVIRRPKLPTILHGCISISHPAAPHVP